MGALASDAEKTKYRSLVQQMAWPARHSLPALAYEVSNLQQRTEGLTVHGILQANYVLKLAKEMCERGDKLIFHAIPGKWGVVVAHDAGFAQQPLCKIERATQGAPTHPIPRAKAGELGATWKRRCDHVFLIYNLF